MLPLQPAEHFDVLHRVSKGGLGARVSGTSQVELLEYLKKVTNQMIESVSREMTERKRAEGELRKHRDHLEDLVKARTGELITANEQLQQEIVERKRAEEERERLISELRDALAEVKTLSGLLPICSSCKNIRDDKGYWNQIEGYIKDHSEAEFSHSICPECTKKLYPEFWEKRNRNN
jgi:DNA repair exonuclease SbcCD ATPase subunit